MNFVEGGGELVIWDSEDPYPNVWDYSWLPTPFSTAVPGAMGAKGTMTIVEENMLSTPNPRDQYFIDANALSTQTDAIGDANVFTGFVPSQSGVLIVWRPIPSRSPVRLSSTRTVQTALVGDGIAIYNGLDGDYTGITRNIPHRVSVTG